MNCYDFDDFMAGPLNWLGWSASRKLLSAAVHADGPGASRVAFAALARTEEDNLVFEYLARLLVTESERDQWAPLSAVDYDFRPSDYWNVAESRGGHEAALLGDEYLHDAEPGEVEIARIVFASAGEDVISIRAVRQNGFIDYRVVDEYERTFRCAPTHSTHPLTLGELVTLIDTCELVEDDGRGLVQFFLESQVLPKGDLAHQRQTLRNFIRVESEFYPGVLEHYEREIERWVETGHWRQL